MRGHLHRSHVYLIACIPASLLTCFVYYCSLSPGLFSSIFKNLYNCYCVFSLSKSYDFHLLGNYLVTVTSNILAWIGNGCWGFVCLFIFNFSEGIICCLLIEMRFPVNTYTNNFWQQLMILIYHNRLNP